MWVSAPVASPTCRFCEQIGQRHAQDLGDEPQVEDRDVPLTTLDRADERPEELALLGQLTLGQFARQPPLAKAVAEIKSDRSRSGQPRPAAGVRKKARTVEVLDLGVT